MNVDVGHHCVFGHVIDTIASSEIMTLTNRLDKVAMDTDKARELTDKLNLGVGRASTSKAWRTKLTETETPDGDLLDAGVERVDEAEFSLGHVGPATPCCEAPGEEHTEGCSMHGRDNAHPWDD